MQLKDIHADMERYLKEDCYCPGEIYDISGFFFKVFTADEECTLLAKGKSKREDTTITCVVCNNQLINFWIESDSKVIAAERYDATDNNIKQMVEFLNGVTDTVYVDEYEDSNTTKSLEEIMRYADAIMVSK